MQRDCVVPMTDLIKTSVRDLVGFALRRGDLGAGVEALPRPGTGGGGTLGAGVSALCGGGGLGPAAAGS